MRYQTIKNISVSTLRRRPGQTLYISGAPGLGKTSLAYDVADALEIPRERVLIFRPSLKDPVDLMGVPSPEGGVTHWNPPADLHRYTRGTGKGMIVWDELPQGVQMMQNAIAGAMLDRFIGDLHFDPEVVMLATGNRTQDKAGASRVVSQLANRMMHLEMEAHLDDWCTWAMTSGIDPLMIAFMRLRPDMLHDFSPDRFSNPTPRSWEMVSRSLDPTEMTRGEYHAAVAGLVGEGAGAEYVGFRDIAAKMPNVDAILIDPDKAEVPTEPGILFAVSTALAMRSTVGNFDRVMSYLMRLPVEFSTMSVKDCLLREPKVKSTKAFTEWAVKNSNVFV